MIGRFNKPRMVCDERVGLYHPSSQLSWPRTNFYGQPPIFILLAHLEVNRPYT